MKSSQLLVYSVIAFIVLSGIYLVGKDSNLFSIFSPNETVYVPRLGTIWCEQGTQLSDQIKTTASSTGKGYELFSGIPGSSAYFVYSNYPDYKDSFSYVEYSCTGYQCNIGNINIDNFSCTNGSVVWFALKNGYLLESTSGHELRSGSPYDYVGEKGDKIESYSLQSGDKFQVGALCVREDPFNYNVYAAGINIPVSGYHSQLVFHADGSKYAVAGSTGCTVSEINTAVSNSASQPVSKNTFNVASNSVTGGTIDLRSDYRANCLPVSQCASIVYEWKSLPSTGNVITVSEGLDSGKKLYANPNGTVYTIETVQTSTGSLSVAGSIYKTNVECFSTDQCNLKYGSGLYQCRTSDGSFKCVQNYSKPCTFDSQCSSPQFISEGGKAYYLTERCLSSQCVLSKTLKACNPLFGYPSNGCPSDKTSCNSDGSACSSQVIPKVACPNECCTESNYYYKKDCTTGSCNVVSETGLGRCVNVCPDNTEPVFKNGKQYCLPSCATGYARNSNGECVGIQNTCSFPYSYYKKQEPVLFGLLGSTPVEGCALDSGFLLLVFGVIAILVIAVLFMPKKRK